MFHKTLYIWRPSMTKMQLNHVKAGRPIGRLSTRWKPNVKRRPGGAYRKKAEKLNSIWTLCRQYSNLYIVFRIERRFFNSIINLREQSIRLRISIFESNRAFLNGSELCDIPLFKIYASYYSCTLKSLQKSYTLIVKTKNYPWGSSKSFFSLASRKLFTRALQIKFF